VTNRNLLLFETIFVLLILASILIIHQLRLPIFFRDYSIIFEGAHRMSLGQIPMKDFGIPVGPIGFIVPTLFFEYFGPTWDALLLSQLPQSTGLIISKWLILRRLQLTMSLRCISVFLYALFYVLALSHPWYNITALLLLQLAFYFSMIQRNYSVMLAGIFAGLTVLTKQDFGAVAIILSSLMLLKFGFFDSKAVICGPKDLGLKPSKGLVARFLLFYSLLVLTICLFIAYSGYENFFYWFNYGQDYQVHRFPKVTKLIIFGFALLAVSIWKNNFSIFVSALFFLSSGLTSATSGIGFTHNYWIGFFAIVTSELWKMDSKVRMLMVIIFVLPMLYKMQAASKNVFFISEGIYLNEFEHYDFNYRKIITEFEQPESLYAFNTIGLPRETIKTIEELKLYAQEKFTEDDKIKVFNMSELTPIYSELGVKPPIGLPLWFHSKVIMFDKEVDKISMLFRSNFFDLILIQSTHENPALVYEDLFNILDNNPTYFLFKSIIASPINAAGKCENRCEGEIRIYKKR